MTEPREIALDRLLDDLKRAERAARPVMSDDLLARVLGDAAEVAAERQATAPVRTERAATGRVTARARAGLRWSLFTWPSGAVAAMVLGLLFGVSVGYGLGDEAMAFASMGGMPDLMHLEDEIVLAEGRF